MEFWRTFLENPSEEKSMNDFAIAIDTIPKIVFSHTLKNVEWESATIANRDLNETILEMCNQILKCEVPKENGNCRFGDSNKENLAEVILNSIKLVA